MTYEEKAKAYDKAIEELRGLLEGVHEEKCEIMEEDIIKIFPELKENEDEKIRKEITELVWQPTWKTEKEFNRRKELIAWLEKQGEQKPANKPQRIISAEAKEAMYDKPVWSEEDEKMLNDAIGAIGIADYYTYDYKQEIENWLKSLKDRYTWKPSDEQMDALQYVYRNCNPLPSDKLGWDSIRTLESLYQELKKLRGE